jgi:hypothetical protein
MPTVKFGLPYIASDQAQKHVPHTAALDDLDAFLAGVAVSATTTAAPAAPAEGEAYIVPAGASGFGAAQAGDLAVWRAGAWKAVAPAFGWRFLVADEGAERIFAGSAGWVRGAALGPLTGAGCGLAVFDAELDLSGPSAAAPGLIPTRAVVLGVTSWTIQAVTGAASYQVGDGAVADRFGGFLGIAAGASNIGVVGPYATFAPADVVVAAQGADFTGGRVGLAAMVILPTPAPV